MKKKRKRILAKMERMARESMADVSRGRYVTLAEYVAGKRSYQKDVNN